MSHAAANSTKPRAMIHKKILDVASERPDASLDDIAAQVSSANTDLVERVLDEYGDPGNTPPPEHEDRATTDTPGIPPGGELTEKQRRTLQVITEHPEASQREIADLLDVSAPTVSRRVNTIADFDWSDRHSIATAILDSTPAPDAEIPDPERPDDHDSETPPSTDDETPPAADTPSMSQNATTQEPLEELADRITALERELETTADSSTERPFGGDTELLSKIIHACMESDTITEDEELQIIEQLLQ